MMNKKLSIICVVFASIVLGAINTSAFAQNVTSIGANPPTGIASSPARAAYEPEIIQIIELIQQGQLDQALTRTNAHLNDYPKSRIAHLLKADVLAAMATQLADIGGSSLLDTQTDSDGLTGLKNQIKSRWSHASSNSEISQNKLPASLIYLGDHSYVMVADMAESRLYLYRNRQGTPELVRNYYMSVGSSGYGKQVEGDNKTPIGVYAVNQYIPGAKLPDLYGKGAFPVDYPNVVDRYRNRTGYGIWLHGTPSDTYARAPWASEGCFVLSNDDLLDIGQYISADNQTPVVLSDQINWVTPDELSALRDTYMSVLAAWKQDWESLDTQAYLNHYSTAEFNFGRDSFRQWAANKKLVNQSKTFVQVDLSLESLFLYPGEKDMFVVKYQQRYLSNNYQSTTNKQQYWRRHGDGRWQIVYEG